MVSFVISEMSSDDKLIDEVVANNSEESIKDIVDLIVGNKSSLNPIDVELCMEAIESNLTADDIGRVVDIIQTQTSTEDMTDGHDFKPIDAKRSANLSSAPVFKTRRKGSKNGSNSGKQLRFLFHHLGRLRVTNSSKSGQQTNVQTVGTLDTEIVTRSKTKIVPKTAEPSPPPSESTEKSTKKSTISQKFVRKLCKYLEDCRQNGSIKEKVSRKEFQPFLPVINIKKLDTNSIEGPKVTKTESVGVVVSKKSKTNKCLTKLCQSLLKKKKKKRTVGSKPMLKIYKTAKMRSESAFLTKKCRFCGNDGNYKTRHRLMSSYLKTVFPRHETRSYGTQLKVKITKNWSSRVRISFGNVIKVMSNK